MFKENTSLIFANNITVLRKQLGLSQYDLANKTGISQRMISHYENDSNIPPIDRLQALATALEVPVSKLFESKTAQKTSPADLTGIDPRSVKKLKDILSLPVDDRNDLYRILNKMVRKNLLEKQKASS
jgi:transcriptional regulator with XRE-family HTH domain